MENKNSQEYKLVMSLFDSGKITEEDRDKLLAALDGDDAYDGEVGVESKIDDTEPKKEDKNKTRSDADSGYKIVVTYAVTGRFSASEIKAVCAEIDGVKAVRTDTASQTVVVCGDFGNSEVILALENAGFSATPTVINVNEHGKKIRVDINDGDVHVDIGDKPAGEYIKNAFGKIGAFVGKSVKAVGRTTGDIVHAVADFITDITTDDDDDNIVRNVTHEKYDVPYEELTVYVKYVNGGNVFKYSNSTKNVDEIKAACVSAMPEDAYAELYQKLNEKFVGSFKYVKGPRVLRMTVEPDDE